MFLQPKEEEAHNTPGHQFSGRPALAAAKSLRCLRTAGQRRHLFINVAWDESANSGKVSSFIQLRRCDSCPMPPGMERK
jgi:hypothetical protein